MKYELDLTKADRHPVSGFLGFPGDAFSPEQKSRFLRIYEQTGDRVKAMDNIGYSRRVLETHLAVDDAFREAFENTMDTMRYKVEAASYQKSLEPQGSTDRAMWLRANWPEKYKPTPEPQAKETKSDKLKALLKKSTVEVKGNNA